MDELWHLRRRLLRILVEYGTRKMMQEMMQLGPPLLIQPIGWEEWRARARKLKREQMRKRLRVVKGGED